MTLREAGELSLVERIRSTLSTPSEDLNIGIGDDAALVRSSPDGTLLTADSMIEDIHFRWDLFTPFQVGYRLVVRNVSDIHAMGGIARWAVLTFALPPDMSVETFDGILKGIKACCKRYGLTVVGGDLSSSKRTMLSMTVLGQPQDTVIKRSGARPGQKIYLTGPPGEGALGLYILKAIKRPVRVEEGERLNLSLEWSILEPLLRRVCLPDLPGPADIKRFQACIDISDGLCIDLWRVCQASSCGARLFSDRIPITDEMKRVSREFGLDLWEFVLSGGEDYQLLLVGDGPAEDLYEIGQITEEGPFELVEPSGKIIPLNPDAGYEHFRTIKDAS